MRGSAPTVRCELRNDGSLFVTLDDGGLNVLRPEVLDDLRAAFEEHPDAPVLLTGRPGTFSAGLDLRWMAAHGPDGLGMLLRACGRALVAVWTHPRPVVVAASGHAVAAGTMLAMAGDHVVAATGGVWGLNETRNGMEIPRFGIELAAMRLGPRDLAAHLIPGERVDAARAVAVGMADELAAPDLVTERAEQRLGELASLPPAAYRGNKRRLRAAVAQRILDGMDADVDGLTEALRAASSGA